MEDILVNGIIILKTEHLRIENDSLFLIILRDRMDIVKLSGIDKEKTFLIHFEMLRVNTYVKFSFFQINDLQFIMPVVFDFEAYGAAQSQIKGTGEETCSVGTDFFQVLVETCQIPPVA